MSHFSFKVQKLPIFKVFNLRKENFSRLALWYLSCTIPRPKFEKKKIYLVVFTKVEIFKKNVILGPIFMVCVWSHINQLIKDKFLNNFAQHYF